MLTVGSCFSGVGGFDLGFVRAGFNVRWQCEIDRDCQDVLRKQFPETDVIYSNILTMPTHQVEPVDIIIGGFPCQDLSVAGRRAGLDGSRSGLFFEFARVIDTVRPTLAVIENVPGLLSSHGGRDMGVILRTLRDIGARDIAWCVLDAQWFGVPQRRRRVFLVADFAGSRASEILALPEGLQGHPPPRRAQGEGVAGSLGGGTGARGWANDLDNSGAFIAGPLTVGTVSAKWAKGTGGPAGDECYNLVTHSLTGVGSEDGTGRGTPIIAIQHTMIGRDKGGPEGKGWRDDGQAFTLDGRGEGGAVAFAQNQRGELRTSAIAPQPTTGGGKPGEGYPAVMSSQLGSVEDGSPALRAEPGGLGYPVSAPMGIRRLTPQECELLMAWPVDHTRYGASGKEMSDSTRYRQCGNGVVSNVAEWIAERIKGALDG
jgi:DNA (cytosine-5)-methyltransferase 1